MKTILIIDDDVTFREVLGGALAARGFEVRHGGSGPQALTAAEQFSPEWILLDLRIGRESGLALIAPLLAADPFARIVVLTGYANIATAVEAIKLGAVHYLAKPATTEEILAAFEKTGGDAAIAITTASPSVAQVESDYIRAALARNSGNISATARELRMHRRTLQRKLEKRV